LKSVSKSERWAEETTIWVRVNPNDPIRDYLFNT